MSIRLISLGSAHEIGDTAYLLEMDGTSVILDAGAHPRRDGRDALPHYECVSDHDIEAILISHCHLDHLGSLPVALSQFPHARVFLSAASAPLAPLMLKHNVRVMERLRLEEGIGDYPLFSLDDVEVISYVMQGMRTDRPFPIYATNKNGCELQARFYDAGHILGAVGIHLESPGGSVFYTGDTSAHDQEILPGAEYPEGPVDVLISECTLAADEGAERRTWNTEVQRLARAVTDVIHADGSVLVPVFSLGRNQEMLALLHRLREEGRIPDVELYTAGMGYAVSEIYDRTRRYSRRIDGALRLDDLEVTRLPRDLRRGRHLRDPSIIVVSSGMMAPQTMSYRLAERMLPEARHGIFFVGYVDPEMPGYRVMTSTKGESVQLATGGESLEVACRIERFHFSAHSSRNHLVGLVDRLRPKTLVIVHGEREAATWLRDTMARRRPGMSIVTPEQEQGLRLI